MAGTHFGPNQRVKVDLSGLVVHGVSFSQNVREALAMVVEAKASDPSTYLVELLFSFKGVKRIEVPGERIKAA